MTVNMDPDVGRRSRSLDIDADPSSQRRPDQKGLPAHLVFSWAKEQSLGQDYEAVNFDEDAGLVDVTRSIDIEGPPTFKDYKSESKR
jgi:hypothetical protein